MVPRQWSSISLCPRRLFARHDPSGYAAPKVNSAPSLFLVNYLSKVFLDLFPPPSDGLRQDRLRVLGSRTNTDRADCSIPRTSSLIDRVRGPTPLILHQILSCDFPSGRGGNEESQVRVTVASLIVGFKVT